MIFASKQRARVEPILVRQTVRDCLATTQRILAQLEASEAERRTRDAEGLSPIYNPEFWARLAAAKIAARKRTADRAKRTSDTQPREVADPTLGGRIRPRQSIEAERPVTPVLTRDDARMRDILAKDQMGYRGLAALNERNRKVWGARQAATNAALKLGRWVTG